MYKRQSCFNSLRQPLSSHLLFLVCLFWGGLLASLYDGSFLPRMSMSLEYHKFFATMYTAPTVLFLGGIFVGFGTSMAGGCTSGHGLNGCARGQSGSLLTTMSFFGTAILASRVFAWAFGI